MSVLGTFWRRICEPLDGFLWQRDITHHLIRPLLRNQILAAGACILAGGACYLVFPGLFWAGMGLMTMVWVFWSWARFFSRINLGAYSAPFLRTVLWRCGGRLALLAVLLYVALAVCKAPAGAILAGMVGGAVIAIASAAYYGVFQPRRLP